MKNKLKTGIEFLKLGKSFLIDDLRLEMNSLGILTVMGWSRYLNFSNLTKVNSLNELEEIKNIFAEMMVASDDFKNFVADKVIEYVLCFDDGGKASIYICSEKNDIINWKVEL